MLRAPPVLPRTSTLFPTRRSCEHRGWVVGTMRAAGVRSCRFDALISQPGGPGPASGLERCGGRVRWEQRCVRPAVVLDACVAHHRSMSTPTFIAVLDFSVSARDRSMAVAQLGREGSTLRSMPVCVAFRVLPAHDPDTDD